MTPKSWITRERMSLALPLLAKGLSNKQVAKKLSCTFESNFAAATNDSLVSRRSSSHASTSSDDVAF